MLGWSRRSQRGTGEEGDDAGELHWRLAVAGFSGDSNLPSQHSSRAQPSAALPDLLRSHTPCLASVLFLQSAAAFGRPSGTPECPLPLVPPRKCPVDLLLGNLYSVCNFCRSRCLVPREFRFPGSWLQLPWLRWAGSEEGPGQCGISRGCLMNKASSHLYRTTLCQVSHQPTITSCDLTDLLKPWGALRKLEH